MMMMIVVAWSDDHNHDLWSPCQSIWRFGNLTGGDYGKDDDFDEEGDHFDVEDHHDQVDVAEAQQVEIVLKDPEKRGCSAEIENSTLTKHTDDDYVEGGC